MASLGEKDEQILELTEKNSELTRQVIELEEEVRAKGELVRARTEAVALMTADLSARGKSTLDLLEETRQEMRSMQVNFAQQVCRKTSTVNFFLITNQLCFFRKPTGRKRKS